MSDKHLHHLFRRLSQFMEDYAKIIKAREKLTAEAMAILEEVKTHRSCLQAAPDALSLDTLKALLEAKLGSHQPGLMLRPTHGSN